VTPNLSYSESLNRGGAENAEETFNYFVFGFYPKRFCFSPRPPRLGGLNVYFPADLGRFCVINRNMLKLSDVLIFVAGRCANTKQFSEYIKLGEVM